MGFPSFLAPVVLRSIRDRASPMKRLAIVRRRFSPVVACLSLAASLAFLACGCAPGIAGSATPSSVPQSLPHSVTLTWTASTSSVIGYRVYRSSQSGGPYALLLPSPVSGTSFIDTTVQAGETYFYVATSVDSEGNESVFSDEASATVPTP